MDRVPIALASFAIAKGPFTLPLAIAILKSDSLAIVMLAKASAKICLFLHGTAITKEA